MKDVKIKKVTTNEPNVSERYVSYDVYVDGVYTMTFQDVVDALDYKGEVEKG